MPTPKTILCFGEALWDLLPTGPRLGGAPLNLAYRLSALGDRSVLVTRVGHDEYGHLAALRLAELGMDSSAVQWDSNHPTGTVEVRIDAQGNPDFTIFPHVAFDSIEVNYELMELAQRADCIAFGTVAQRTPVSATTLSRLLGVSGEKPRFLDLNLRKDCYNWQTIQDSIAQATVLKLNADEARRVAFGFDLPVEPLPDFCAALLRSCSLVVCLVTLGERGAFAAMADGTRVYEPGYEVRVADTCGSGDAFSAGFLHGYMRGQPLAWCLRLGNVMGTLVATQPGATEPLARAQLDAWMANPPPRRRAAGLEAFEVSG